MTATQGTRLRLDEHGLVRWSPKPPPGAPRTVAEVLDAVLAKDPDRPALIDDEHRLTYGELDVAVNRVADVLRQEGLRPGDRVAACLPNSADVVVAFLAAMRSGLVWVGINRVLAPPERAGLLADSGAAIMLTEPGAEAGTPEGTRPLPLDAQWWAKVAAASTRRPDVVIDPHAPAGIAYTSGTTGTPKGAVHSQHTMLVPALVSGLRAGDPDGTVEGARLGVVLPLTILNLQILGPVAAYLRGATLVPTTSPW